MCQVEIFFPKAQNLKNIVWEYVREQQNMATREDNGGGKHEGRQYHIPKKRSQ